MVDQIIAVTITVATRAIGGYPGHARVHPKVLERATRMLKEQVKAGTITDSGIIHCGDLLGLILTGAKVPGDLIEQTFAAGQDEATELHLCPSDRNTRTIELALIEREHEPVLVLMTDAGTKVAQILYRVFADPLLTTRLVSDPRLGEGFIFELTTETGVQHRFTTPGEAYQLLERLADGELKAIRVLQDNTVAAMAGMDRTGGTILIRTEGSFPAVSEVLALFLSPHLTAAMALMPVSICDAHNTASAGVSRITAFGFALNRGRLIGPADLFDDPAFDPARMAAVRMAELRRLQGPFQP